MSVKEPEAVCNALATAERVGDAPEDPATERLPASEQTESLPEPVKRRVKALKRLQLQTTMLEARFYEEVQRLEVKYHSMYMPLFDKRAEIIMGRYEPNEDECQWDLDDEDEEGGSTGSPNATRKNASRASETGANPSKSESDKVALTTKEEPQKKTDIEAKAKDKEQEKDKDKDKEKKKETPAEDIRGVPDFWLTIFKNVQVLSDMVQEHDEPILKHLSDIKVVFNETNPMIFVLEFHFSPNEYFTDTLLTKEYEMKCRPEDDDPFSFEGPEIFKCKGCEINWKKGMNVTVKLVKKKQKHKSRGVVRTIVKPVQRDSFFNFFSPPTLPDDPEAEVDDDTYALVTSDIETGHYIRERIVPRAVLYYTGEALDEEEFDEEMSSSEDDDSSEDEDEDDENENEDQDSEASPKTVPEHATD